MIVKKFAVHSQKGETRNHNEDAYICCPESGIYAISDGVGGLPCGELASRKAIDVVGGSAHEIHRKEDLESLFYQANEMVLKLANEKDEFILGATLEVLFFKGKTCYIGHLGDGVCYYYSSKLKKVFVLTKEHTLAQEELEKGNDNFPESYHNILTQALGCSNEINPNIISQTCDAGDCFLLCSDGVSKFLSQDSIFETILKTEKRAAHIIEALFQKLQKGDAADDATAIIVFV